jgi:tRNA pseudouridine55 synthase
VEVPVPEHGVGVLLWDKPAGMTSHDVIEEIRRATGLKAGHVGTLDPFATGLLVILLGRATRLQRYLVGLPKGYMATARYGWTSTTGDPDGILEETGRIPGDLEIPVGTFEQTVPMTSAVKVDGERLYRKAHRGETVSERPSREVTVLESRLLELERDPGGKPVRGRYELRVSSGTYVRTLVTDLGDAYCESLRRTSVGSLGIEQAGTLVNPIEALAFLPRADLDQREAKSCSNGVAIEDRWGTGDGGRVLLVDGGELVGVGRGDGHQIRSEVVLRPAAG